jgi:hypothetical protein
MGGISTMPLAEVKDVKNTSFGALLWTCFSRLKDMKKVGKGHEKDG